MTYLLDTTAFSDLMREEPRTVARHQGIQPDDTVTTCSIVKGEILFGIERMPAGKRRTLLTSRAHELFSLVTCDSVPPAAADAYVRVRLQSVQTGLGLNDNDLWIAATALATQATLITRDKDFLSVTALPVQDWSA